MSRTLLGRLLVLLAAASLLVAGCGNDDGATSTTEPESSSTTLASTTTTDGDGDDADADADDEAVGGSTTTTAGSGSTTSVTSPATTTTVSANDLSQLPSPPSCEPLLNLLSDGVSGMVATDHTGGFELLGLDSVAGSFDLNLYDPNDGARRLLRVRDGSLVGVVTGAQILLDAEIYLGFEVVSGILDPSATEMSECFSYIYGSS